MFQLTLERVTRGGGYVVEVIRVKTCRWERSGVYYVDALGEERYINPDEVQRFTCDAERELTPEEIRDALQLAVQKAADAIERARKAADVVAEKAGL